MNVKFDVDDMTIYEHIWSIGWLKYCMKYWIILSKSGWPNLSTAERLCKVDVNPLALVFSLYSFLAPLLVALYSFILYTSVFRWWNPYEIHMKSIWNPYICHDLRPLNTTERISAGSPKDDPGCFWSSTVHWLLDTPWTFMACNAAASWSSRGSVDAVDEQSWLPMAITGNQELRPKSPSDSHVVPGVAPIFHELWDFELSNFQQCIWSTPVFFWGCCADSFWCFKAARRIGNDSDRQHFWTYCEVF